MRKLLLAVGLLAGGILLSGSPAQATYIGCACATLTKAPVCTSGIASCAAMGGACVMPCDYKAPKKMAKRHHGKKKKKM